jgi:ankyrin repeat protein
MYSALIYACDQNNFEIVKYLVENGADINTYVRRKIKGLGSKGIIWIYGYRKKKLLSP